MSHSRFSNIAERASRQLGNVTFDQLRAHGFSADTIQRMAASGLLQRRHRGVYALGHVDRTDASAYAAAVLAVGDDAALSHCTAAHHLGILRRRACSIHVTCPRRSSVPGIRTSQVADMPPTFLHRGVPVTELPRTILDLAQECDAEELANAIHEAQFRFALDLEQLAARAATTWSGHRGIRTLRAAIAIIRGDGAGTKSGLEQGVRRYVMANASVEAPIPNASVAVNGGTIEVDLWWPDRRLAVEVDGPGHLRARTRREDRVRDERLRAAGITPLRVDGAEFRRDPAAATAHVLAALRATR